MLTDDEVIARSAYDALAAEYAKTFPDLSAETQADRDLIAAFCERVPAEGHVLDLGCGTGRVTADLRHRGLLVAGMDVSRGMLVEARRRDPEVPVVVGSLVNLPFGHGTAGGVLAWYSVIHTAPAGLPAVVAELARVLRPGAPCLIAFQSGTGERIERAETLGKRVQRINYRHDVVLVRSLLEQHHVHIEVEVVRPPATSFESTDQAFLLAVRG